MDICDSHTHLDAPDFASDREEVISRAKAAGVSRIVTSGSGYGIDSIERTIEIARSHEGIWATAGFHPHEAGNVCDFEKLKSLALQKEVVAIGEIGLDFFRDWSPFDLQEKIFHEQIELALEIRKPLAIHSRNAGEKVLKILREHKASVIGGVFHCYAEDDIFAKEIARENFLVSFPGTLTFKNTHRTREIAKAIPLEQIMIETDAPYMAPVPYRGKRCESYMVVETARMLAEIKGLTLEETARVTTENAIRLFGLE